MTVIDVERSLIEDIASGIAAATPLWRAHVRHDPSCRRPVRLLATPVYEVWVIGWTAGQGVGWHDHGESAGAVVVVEGELTEHAGDRSTALGPGALLRVPVGHVHDVVNDGAGPATSIHVYSPPLSPDEDAPVFAVDAATLLAHPSAHG